MEIRPIAYFRSPFGSKFGIPRQSGVVPEIGGSIVFEPEFRNADALRGMEEFEYIWLIWEFSANRPRGTKPETWQPTVRPPRLGGNERVGVFASRSPFRPNGLGLSSVRIGKIEPDTPEGPVIHVLGADLMDGTPIYDIKPYVAYADSHPDARSGFVDTKSWSPLTVVFPPELRTRFIASGRSAASADALGKILEQDPRPQYHDDPSKVYGMAYDGMDVRFRVEGNCLTIIEIL